MELELRRRGIRGHAGLSDQHGINVAALQRQILDLIGIDHFGNSRLERGATALLRLEGSGVAAVQVRSEESDNGFRARQKHAAVLATRASREIFEAVAIRIPCADYFEEARIIQIGVNGAAPTETTVLVVCAVFAPWLAPYDPANQQLMDRLNGPSWQHPFGNDDLGRDILSRILLGTRVSMRVGATVVLLSGIAGVFLGGFAGYIGFCIGQYRLGWIRAAGERASPQGEDS